MCIVVSAMKNAEAPGIFTDTVNQLLSANNLPKFSLGTITLPTMQNFVQQSQSTTTPPPTSNKEEEQLQSPPFEATLYRKKSTPTVTPTNVKALHNAGIFNWIVSSLLRQRVLSNLHLLQLKNLIG